LATIQDVVMLVDLARERSLPLPLLKLQSAELEVW
jgi:hypothetical protein